MLSGWFCLDPVTPQTGALRIAAGSHSGPMYVPFAPPERAADVAADSAQFFLGGPLPDVDADPVRFPIRSFECNPGDVLFFHPRTLHSALGSAPTHPRRTFSIRFLGDDIRWQPKRSIFYGSLSKVSLREGDPLSGPDFPELMP
jgi:ectoine hydroxylase-related dioxygenase (phytanoyl-CoA dioxygenase family)